MPGSPSVLADLVASAMPHLSLEERQQAGRVTVAQRLECPT